MAVSTNNIPVLTYNIATININAISSQNKINALKTYVKLMELDIIFLQEVENKNLDINGYNIITNVDFNKRGTAIALRDHIKYSNVEYSLDTRIICMKICNNITLCNIYAPPGSQNRVKREEFYNSTLPYYLRCSDPKTTIIGGDFNSISNLQDATGTSNMSKALHNLEKSLKLTDSWKALHPRKTEYSFIRGLAASRIDRIYAGEGLKTHITKAYFGVTSFSDHKAFIIRIGLPNLGKPSGKGIWTMRSHVLTSENLEEFQHKWNYITRQKRFYNSWVDWWLNLAKPKITSFFRWKTNLSFKEFHNKLEYFYSKLKTAYDDYLVDPNKISEVNRIKAHMLQLQHKFSQNYIRINETYLAGEKMSLFNIGEKAQKKSKFAIKSIKTSNGSEIEDHTAIENHVKSFFTELYTSNSTVVDNVDNIEQKIPENDNENKKLVEPITTNEIFEAIKSSASRKSPGSDGIPKEFYHKAFDIIHRELNLVINEVKNGCINKKFTEGIIVLVKKKGGNDTMKAYRPISLLNFDYKILMRILKIRMESLVQKCLSSSQKCSNGTKNIYEAVWSINDKIMDYNHKRKPGRLISFDLDHAFDRVERNFLFKVMEKFGFNTEFVELIKKIMKNSFSRILINGNLTDEIQIQRSVRQGDPISMHLFVLYMQPLINKIEQICTNPMEVINAYADDISVIITNQTNLDSILNAFQEFSSKSGAKLNVDKTVTIKIGTWTEGNGNVDVLNLTESIKILGIIFENNQKDMLNRNWNEVVSKLTRFLWSCQSRNLNLQQKITFLNTFATSKLWFVSSILPNTNKYIAKIKTQMGIFIWGRYPTRVSIMQLSLPKLRGGQNLQLPCSKCKALYLNRYLKVSSQMKYLNSQLMTLENPPNIAIYPASFPCLRALAAELPYIPQDDSVRANSRNINLFYISQHPDPKCIADHHINWKALWKNINNKKLSSNQRSLYYLLVNNKIPNKKLLYEQGRIDNSLCEKCQKEEDLKHKFSECQPIANLWTHLSRRIRTLTRNSFDVTFEALCYPVLSSLSRTEKTRALQKFINFVEYCNNNSIVTIEELNVVLDL